MLEKQVNAIEVDENLEADYRNQIDKCTRAFAIAKNDVVLANVADERPAFVVKMFTDGNLDKRFLKLKDHFEESEEVLDNLENRLVEFVKTVPLQAYDTGSSDAISFLNWLCNRDDLSMEQLDHVALHRTRFEVEERAIEDRLGHVRFQEVHSQSERMLEMWGDDDSLVLMLNPIRATATFQTREFIDDEDDPPIEAVFFPVANDIHTVILEDEGVQLFERLIEKPCSFSELLDDWSSTSFDVYGGREEIISAGVDLVEAGLAAFC